MRFLTAFRNTISTMKRGKRWNVRKASLEDTLSGSMILFEECSRTCYDASAPKLELTKPRISERAASPDWMQRVTAPSAPRYVASRGDWPWEHANGTRKVLGSL